MVIEEKLINERKGRGKEIGKRKEEKGRGEEGKKTDSERTGGGGGGGKNVRMRK